MKILTTKEFKALMGFKFDREAARFFGVSPPAVTKWRGVVPPGRVHQLQKLTPGKFDRYRVSVENGPRGASWVYK